MALSEKIIATIKNKHLQPIPRWHYIIKNYLFIILYITAITIGGFVFSAGLFLIANQDWGLNTYLKFNPIIFYLSVLPYFWLLALAIFAGLSFYNLYRTKRGYKFPIIIAIIIYLLSTSLLGYGLYKNGIGVKIEQTATNLPYYNRLNYTRAVWSKHEDGLMAGKIINIQDNKIKLMDLDGETWTIDVGSSTGKNLIYEEKDIKIFGEKINSTTFKANSIKPWCGCSGCAKHQGQSCVDHCRALMQ